MGQFIKNIFQAIQNKERLVRHLKVTFVLICLLLTVYMTAKETIRYIKNEDSSTISYKQFNKHPHDTYPTFSICFTDDQPYERNFYSQYEPFINSNILGLYTNEYTEILQGKVITKYINNLQTTGNSERKELDIRNISESDFERFSLKFKDMINRVELKTKNVNNSIEFDSDLENRLPVYVSYQAPETKCFTRKKEDKLDVARMDDTVSLRIEELKTFNSLVKIKIYIHHPGQLLRVFDSPIFQSTTGAFDWLRNIITFKISQVSILRKRENAKNRCNRDLYDDDLQFRLQIANMVGCIPLYWKWIMPTSLKLGTCKSPENMRNINKHIQNFAEIQSKYEPPCNEMKLVATIDQQRNDIGSISFLVTNFIYMERNYQEIVNVREFGFESFWSGVGGFVGIFMGSSLLQVPDLISAILNWKYNRNRGEIGGNIFTKKKYTFMTNY